MENASPRNDLERRLQKLLERYERSERGVGKRNGYADSGALDGDHIVDLFGGQSDAAKLAAKSTVVDGGADRGADRRPREKFGTSAIFRR